MLGRLVATPLISVPPLRQLLMTTSLVVRPIAQLAVAFARRSPAIFVLVVTLGLFVPVLFVQRETLAPDLVAIGVTIALAYSCFVVTRDPASRAAVATVANLLLVLTLALDWNAFGVYWAVALTLLAMSAGVAMYRRNGGASV